jgi:Cu-Zn family superoxide dismutase
MGNSYSTKSGSTLCTDNPRNAVCILSNNGNKSNIIGFISFHQCSPDDIVRVRFTLYGNAGETHAIHIHEYGDMSDGCKTLGGHFNPYHQTHGSYQYPDLPRHAGDLINNVVFDKHGHFFAEYEDSLLSLIPGHKSYIVGRSVVIHAGKDDLGQGNDHESLVSGNAGERLNCGIIALSKTNHF